MRKLKLSESNPILVPRRSPEEREKNYLITIQKKIQEYIKNGSKGDLYLKNTPLAKKYTEEEIRKIAPGVKGEIFI